MKIGTFITYINFLHTGGPAEAKKVCIPIYQPILKLFLQKKQLRGNFYSGIIVNYKPAI